MDRRKASERTHPGSTRPAPVVDQIVEDIPRPHIEMHRHRRHIYTCAGCDKRFTAASNEVSPQARVGPNATSFQAYARGHLGLSLAKTNDVLEQFHGLWQSRAAALGQLFRTADAFHPAVRRLFQILRDDPRRPAPALQILVSAREQTLPPGIESVDTAVVVGLSDCPKMLVGTHSVVTSPNVQYQMWGSIQLFGQPLRAKLNF